jgi:hypothetical protein
MDWNGGNFCLLVYIFQILATNSIFYTCFNWKKQHLNLSLRKKHDISNKKWIVHERGERVKRKGRKKKLKAYQSSNYDIIYTIKKILTT